jgi:hypothetical protein
MVQEMVELPKFLVFNSRTNSFGDSSIAALSLLLSLWPRITVLFAKIARENGCYHW